MTLNDEQEKALRAWWKAVDDMSGKRGNPALFALIESLRPLMEPWRVEHDHSVPGLYYSLRGPDGNRQAFMADPAFAARVAALLNESESSR